jgi:hypothetical protein
VDEEAVKLVNGNVLGLSWITSAGVDEPNGLGDEEALGGGIAEGEGGSRSDMPSLCSDVTVGIYN